MNWEFRSANAETGALLPMLATRRAGGGSQRFVNKGNIFVVPEFKGSVSGRRENC